MFGNDKSKEFNNSNEKFIVLNQKSSPSRLRRRKNNPFDENAEMFEFPDGVDTGRGSLENISMNDDYNNQNRIIDNEKGTSLNFNEQSGVGNRNESKIPDNNSINNHSADITGPALSDFNSKNNKRKHSFTEINGVSNLSPSQNSYISSIIVRGNNLVSKTPSEKNKILKTKKKMLGINLTCTKTNCSKKLEKQEITLLNEARTHTDYSKNNLKMNNTLLEVDIEAKIPSNCKKYLKIQENSSTMNSQLLGRVDVSKNWDESLLKGDRCNKSNHTYSLINPKKFGIEFDTSKNNLLTPLKNNKNQSFQCYGFAEYSDLKEKYSDCSQNAGFESLENNKNQENRQYCSKSTVSLLKEKKISSQSVDSVITENYQDKFINYIESLVLKKESYFSTNTVSPLKKKKNSSQNNEHDSALTEMELDNSRSNTESPPLKKKKGQIDEADSTVICTEMGTSDKISSLRKNTIKTNESYQGNDKIGSSNLINHEPNNEDVNLEIEENQKDQNIFCVDIPELSENVSSRPMNNNNRSSVINTCINHCNHNSKRNVVDNPDLTEIRGDYCIHNKNAPSTKNSINVKNKITDEDSDETDLENCKEILIVSSNNNLQKQKYDSDTNLDPSVVFLPCDYNVTGHNVNSILQEKYTKFGESELNNKGYETNTVGTPKTKKNLKLQNKASVRNTTEKHNNCKNTFSKNDSSNKNQVSPNNNIKNRNNDSKINPDPIVVLIDCDYNANSQNNNNILHVKYTTSDETELVNSSNETNTVGTSKSKKNFKLLNKTLVSHKTGISIKHDSSLERKETCKMNIETPESTIKTSIEKQNVKHSLLKNKNYYKNRHNISTTITTPFKNKKNNTVLQSSSSMTINKTICKVSPKELSPILGQDVCLEKDPPRKKHTTFKLVGNEITENVKECSYKNKSSIKCSGIKNRGKSKIKEKKIIDNSISSSDTNSDSILQANKKITVSRKLFGTPKLKKSCSNSKLKFLSREEDNYERSIDIFPISDNTNSTKPKSSKLKTNNKLSNELNQLQHKNSYCKMRKKKEKYTIKPKKKLKQNTDLSKFNHKHEGCDSNGENGHNEDFINHTVPENPIQNNQSKTNEDHQQDKTSSMLSFGKDSSFIKKTNKTVPLVFTPSTTTKSSLCITPLENNKSKQSKRKQTKESLLECLSTSIKVAHEKVTSKVHESTAFQSLVKEAIEEIQNIISNEELKRLELLTIDVDWELPALHAVDHGYPDKLEKSVNLEIDTSQFTEEEEETIKKNWESFSHKYNLCNTDLFVSLATLHQYVGTTEILKFQQFLARGLPERRLFSVYSKFQDIFCRASSRRFSQVEDKILLNMHCFFNDQENNGLIRNIVLPEILGRKPLDISRRLHALLRDKRALELTRPPIDWTPELEGELIHCLLEKSRVESVEDLRSLPLPFSVWRKVVKKLRLPFCQVVDHWRYNIHPRLFSENPVICPILYLQLIKWIHDADIEKWEEINWEELSTLTGGVGTHFLCKCLRMLILNYVPYQRHKYFRACIRYLYLYCWPILIEEEKQYVLKRVRYNASTRLLEDLEDVEELSPDEVSEHGLSPEVSEHGLSPDEVSEHGLSPYEVSEHGLSPDEVSEGSTSL